MFQCFVASTIVLIFDLSDGASQVGEHMHRNKEFPFNGITSYGRVWRKGGGK